LKCFLFLFLIPVFIKLFFVISYLKTQNKLILHQ